MNAPQTESIFDNHELIRFCQIWIHVVTLTCVHQWLYVWMFLGVQSVNVWLGMKEMG